MPVGFFVNERLTIKPLKMQKKEQQQHLFQSYLFMQMWNICTEIVAISYI